ncbi:rab GTPase-binding effector protein 2 isoform X2 [Monodelphis domestica]|uniref:rab GTPase-binding effector protein 2 isoform X2 n=1 Tax=Monodelphis domestica TaxID=13616 RepID=UPI0024E200E7|nr:rab GTPase-binding effector protein 2 isoform X2 [Monodelphis domestica]
MAAAAAATATAGDDGQRQPLTEPTPTMRGNSLEAEAGELGRLKAQLGAALAEMENMKAVAEVSESTKAEAVAEVQRQCREEVASLQTILKDSISSYEARISSLEQERKQQQQDQEARERELARLKQLLSRSHPLDSLEKQMEKAHEDSEKLREIVLPMEQEIAELKGKLLRAEELIQEIQGGQGHPHPQHSLHGSTELLPLPRNPSPPLEPPEDLSVDGGAAAEVFARNCDDSASISSFSLGGAGNSASLPRGRRGMSPEQEETASLISTGTLVPEGIYLPPPGYQLVPEHQWEQLQLEGRQQQESLQQLQRQLDSAGQERDELQEALKRSSEDCAKQVQVLLAQVQNSEKLLQTLQGTVSQAQERAQQQMAELAASHKRVCYEIKRLNEENQGLRCQQPLPVGSRVQEQEQVEEQELPTSPLELQQLIRSTRQEARECRRAQEHEAERLRIEIVTLREALEEETTSRASLERERRLHREETASLCSLRTEMERIQQERSKAEQQLQASQRQPPGPAVGWTEEKAQLTSLLSEQRAKVFRLQAELETSEQVQRDFVRLSQALQVRLERIRQAETLDQVRNIVDETPLRDVKDIKDT